MTQERSFWVFLLVITASALCNCARKKLWFGAFFTVDISGGGWSSAGVLPAVEMAIEDVNNSSQTLQDYELHMEWRDTKCKRGYGIRQFVDLIQLPPEKAPMMLIGGGCSVGTEATAEASHYWNLVQIAFSANSMKLSEKKTYPLLFRSCYAESIGNPARIAFLKKFGWKNVATVYQNEGLFTLTIVHLRRLLDKENFTIITSENLASDPTYQIQNVKQKDARIIIGMFYSDMARKVFCRAYKEGLYGPQYVWLIPGWFGSEWWNATDKSHGCTPEQIKLAAGNYIAIMESTWSSDPRVTVNGQTAAELNERYFARVDKTRHTRNEYSVFGYDAVWAVALTLNKSIRILQAQGRSLEDFNYNDSSMAQVFKSVLLDLHYQGMSGEIRFNSQGDRMGTAIVEQLQGNSEVKIGNYDSIRGILAFQETNQIYWQGGSPPVDRMEVKLKLIAVSMPLFVAMTVLSTIGIVIAMGFLAFNVYFRDRRFIRMSSHRLNNITVVGCIIIYVAAIISGLDGKFVTEAQYTSLCQVQIWILCIGFTLAYGAMFSKTWRVHVLFLRKIERRAIRDNQLLAMVAGLLTIDVIVLATWQIIDPFRRAVKYLPIVEDKSRFIAERPYIEYCTCGHVMEWKGVVLAYKGLLLIFGAFLAWETRNVTIPALNDSKNIGVSVYTVVLSCVVGLPVLLVITDMPDFTFGLSACMCIICTTITLCLMFIPKIITLGKPEEESSIMTGNGYVLKHPKIVPVAESTRTAPHPNKPMDSPREVVHTSSKERKMSRIVKTDSEHAPESNVSNAEDAVTAVKEL